MGGVFFDEFNKEAKGEIKGEKKGEEEAGFSFFLRSPGEIKDTEENCANEKFINLGWMAG